jgi:glycine cleavage system T protein (aminomethyltransferase)
MQPLAVDPHYRRPLLRSPFAERAAPFVQTDAYLPWSGYSTVDVFSSVEQEYFAIRNACSVYDLTPMVKYRIAGRDAERYLNRLVTRNMAKLKPGRVAYAIWCNDAGQVIDDGTIFRSSEDEFRLCTAERQLDWLLDSAIGFSVEIEEVTEQVAALSLQGPTSCAALKKLGLAGIERLKPFEIAHFDFAGTALMVSRTGFTGDLGYELWLAPEAAGLLWDGLMAAGAPFGIRPIGWAAVNMARIEAGFIQINIDFVSAEHTIRTGRDRSPFELGLDWLVDLGKGHFNGRRALVAEQRRGPARRLVGLDIEGNKPADHALLYSEAKAKRQIGTVSSALWSPTCKRNLALAMIEAPYLGGEIWAEIYLNRELVWERRMARARIVDRPFFAPERRKAVPAGDR